MVAVRLMFKALAQTCYNLTSEIFQIRLNRTAVGCNVSGEP